MIMRAGEPLPQPRAEQRAALRQMTENEVRFLISRHPLVRRAAFIGALVFLTPSIYGLSTGWDVLSGASNPSPTVVAIGWLVVLAPALLATYFFYLAFRRRPEVLGLKPWPPVGRYRGRFGVRGKPTFYSINGWQVVFPDDWWGHFTIGESYDVEVCPPIGNQYGKWDRPRTLLTVWTPERVYSIDQEVAKGTLKVPQRRGWFSDPLRRFW